MNLDPSLAAAASAPQGRETTIGTYLMRGLLVGALSLTACSEPGKQSPDWPTPDATTPNSAAPFPDTAPSQPPAELHKTLIDSTDPTLANLGRHEKEFGFRFEAGMLFVDMPRDPEEAEQKALDLAPTLKEYSKQGIKPIVIMEPTYDGGEEMIDLKKLADAEHAEGYKETLEAYFRTLNWEGVSDEQMGRWVLFPEPNIPTWKKGVTDPKVFKRNFILAAQALQTHFRKADISILLERQTYPDGDMNYARGTMDTAALKKYTEGIPKGLVTSVGFQGYPWDKGAEASDFVDGRTLVSLADSLGVSSVWLNTGTYTKAKRDGRDVHFSAAERLELLEAELQEALIARDAGRTVDIMIFGENKYPEDADWSYAKAADRESLKVFLARARGSGIRVSFFDPVY